MGIFAATDSNMEILEMKRQIHSLSMGLSWDSHAKVTFHKYLKLVILYVVSFRSFLIVAKKSNSLYFYFHLRKRGLRSAHFCGNLSRNYCLNYIGTYVPI